MNETNPLSPPETWRKTTPTPPLILPEPAAPSTPDDSSTDPLIDALEAEAQGERWLVLSHSQTWRCSEIRRIEEAGHEEQTVEIDGKPTVARWPLPNLILNGETISRPLWTRDELLSVIGVEVISPPNPDLTWQPMPPPQDQS